MNHLNIQQDIYCRQKIRQEKVLRGMTRPTGEPGSGEVFVLSLTEVYTYFAGISLIPNNIHELHLENGGVNRQAQIPEDAALENDTFVNDWLRSTGHTLSTPKRAVNLLGNFGGDDATANGSGFRPVIWVRR